MSVIELDDGGYFIGTRIINGDGERRIHEITAQEVEFSGVEFTSPVLIETFKPESITDTADYHLKGFYPKIETFKPESITDTADYHLKGFYPNGGTETPYLNYYTIAEPKGPNPTYQDLIRYLLTLNHKVYEDNGWSYIAALALQYFRAMVFDGMSPLAFDAAVISEIRTYGVNSTLPLTTTKQGIQSRVSPDFLAVYLEKLGDDPLPIMK